MATATLYCTSIHNWNVIDDYWEYNGYPISGSYRGVMFNTSTPSSYRLGLQRMTFEALPTGTITSATFYGQSWKYNGTYNDTVYFRASDNADAWHTSDPPDSISKYISFSTTRTDYNFDITTQLTSYGTGGSTLYVYAFIASEIFPDEIDNVWHTSGYVPYINITYTQTSTIGLYNSTTATWNNRIIKKYNGSSWVQCDCYKYNSSTSSWDKISTT